MVDINNEPWKSELATILLGSNSTSGFPSRGVTLADTLRWVGLAMLLAYYRDSAMDCQRDSDPGDDSSWRSAGTDCVVWVMWYDQIGNRRHTDQESGQADDGGVADRGELGPGLVVDKTRSSRPQCLRTKTVPDRISAALWRGLRGRISGTRRVRPGQPPIRGRVWVEDCVCQGLRGWTRIDV